MEDLRLERVFASAHKQYATEPLGRVKVRNDSGEDLEEPASSPSSSRSTWTFPVTQGHPGAEGEEPREEMTLNATFNNKVLGIDEDTRVLVVATLAMADARDGSQEITQAMTLYGKNAIVWANCRHGRLVRDAERRYAAATSCAKAINRLRARRRRAR